MSRTEEELRMDQERWEQRERNQRRKMRADRHSMRKHRANMRHADMMVKRRREQIDRLDDGARLAVRWAEKQLGVEEVPPYSNRGPKIDKWEIATLGYSGYPWCQAFVNAALVAAGGPQLKSAYTPAVVQYARDGAHGLKLVSLAAAQPGDFVYFKFPGVSGDFCDHVGLLHERLSSLVECIEGNTSPGTSGSQNNGGGVYMRQRASGLVVACVRPPY